MLETKNYLNPFLASRVYLHRFAFLNHSKCKLTFAHLISHQNAIWTWTTGLRSGNHNCFYNFCLGFMIYRIYTSVCILGVASSTNMWNTGASIVLPSFAILSSATLTKVFRNIVNKFLKHCKHFRNIVVGCPTRWSLLFIFGFLFWSSQSR